MNEAAKLNALKLRLPDATSEALLLSLLDEAGAVIRVMTGRRTLPEALEYTQIKLAVIAYNRMGVEGESGHSEGGVSISIDAMPDNIRREIAPYRLVVTR